MATGKQTEGHLRRFCGGSIPNTSIFGAKILTAPSSNCRCAETRRNSGKTKTTITTRLYLTSTFGKIRFAGGNLSYNELTNCAFCQCADNGKTYTKLPVAVRRKLKVWPFQWCSEIRTREQVLCEMKCFMVMSCKDMKYNGVALSIVYFIISCIHNQRSPSYLSDTV